MDSNGLPDRLNALLAGRLKHVWGKQIGLGKNQVQGLFSGVLPKPEALAAIRRTENASIDWLMTGSGKPFYVHQSSSDAECADEIRPYLEDEPWSVVLATDHAVLHIVLHNPGQHQMHPKEGSPFWVDYTLMEVFCNAGRATLDTVRELARGQIGLAELPSGAIRHISSGTAGTYRLLLAPDALLRNAAPIDKTNKIFSWPKPQEYSLTVAERELVSAYRVMEPTAQEHYLAIAKGLAKKG